MQGWDSNLALRNAKKNFLDTGFELAMVDLGGVVENFLIFEGFRRYAKKFGQGWGSNLAL